MRKLKDVLDEQAKAETDDRELVSRSDKRKIRNVEADALLALARQLADLPPRQFKKVELVETVMEQVLTARKITSPGARTRQLKLVRRALKTTDWETLAAEVQEIVNPSRGSGAGVLSPGRVWAERLTGGDDAAFEELLALCPGLAPAELSHAVSAARRAGPNAKKALATLAKAVEEMLARAELAAYVQDENPEAEPSS